MSPLQSPLLPEILFLRSTLFLPSVTLNIPHTFAFEIGSLYTALGWPGTHYADRTGLNLVKIHLLLPQVLGLQM